MDNARVDPVVKLPRRWPLRSARRFQAIKIPDAFLISARTAVGQHRQRDNDLIPNLTTGGSSAPFARAPIAPAGGK